jgi:hypothetical protein
VGPSITLNVLDATDVVREPVPLVVVEMDTVPVVVESPFVASQAKLPIVNAETTVPTVSVAKIIHFLDVFTSKKTTTVMLILGGRLFQCRIY